MEPDFAVEDRSVAAQLHRRPKPTVYVVREYENISIPASQILKGGSLNVYASVLQRGYFTARPGRGPLTLQAGGFIGVIPLNEELTIDVRTRVPVGNLSRILRISGQVPVTLEGSWRFYEHEPDLYPSLVDLYAQTLAAHVGEIALRGLMKDYERREDVTSFPHGRILFNETMKSVIPRGLSHKLATTWFQRSADNGANRCLKYALWFLATLRLSMQHAEDSRARSTIALLNRTIRVFDGISLDRQRRFLGDPTVTGTRSIPSLRAYYRPALDLAVAIIHQRAVTLDGLKEEVRMPSLVLNMGQAFEAYIRNVLIAHSHQNAWSAVVLDGNKASPVGGMKRLFDTGIGTRATPDIVVRKSSGAAARFDPVIDVKYKPAHKQNRDDLNQIIAYGYSYRSNRVLVVQPQGDMPEPDRLRLVGRIRDMELYRYAFDLNAEDIEDEERHLVEAVKSLIPS